MHSAAADALIIYKYRYPPFASAQPAAKKGPILQVARSLLVPIARPDFEGAPIYKAQIAPAGQPLRNLVKLSLFDRLYGAGEIAPRQKAPFYSYAIAPRARRSSRFRRGTYLQGSNRPQRISLSAIL